MGAMPCVSTDRSPARLGRRPLKADAVHALDEPSPDMSSSPTPLDLGSTTSVRSGDLTCQPSSKGLVRSRLRRAPPLVPNEGDHLFEWRPARADVRHRHVLVADRHATEQNELAWR